MILWITVGGTVAIFWIVVAVIVAMIVGRMIDLAEARSSRPAIHMQERSGAPRPHGTQGHAFSEATQ